MTNYENIISLSKKDMIDFLSVFDRNKILDSFCKSCKNEICEIQECPFIASCDDIIWWLDQKFEKK